MRNIEVTDPSHRKTYTINLNDNTVLCLVSHIRALTHNNKTYAAPALTSPDKIFRLKVTPGLRC